MSADEETIVAHATLPAFLLPAGNVLFPGVTTKVPIAPSEVSKIVSRLNTLAKALQETSEDSSEFSDSGSYSGLDDTLVDSDSLIPISDDPEKTLFEIKKLQKLLDLKNTETVHDFNVPQMIIAVLPRVATASYSSASVSFFSSDFSSSKLTSQADGSKLNSTVFPHGVIARFIRVERGPNNTFNAIVEGYNRFKALKFMKTDTAFAAEVRVAVYSDSAFIQESASIAKLTSWSRHDLEKVESMKSNAVEIIQLLSRSNGSNKSNNNSPSLAARPELLKTISTMIRHARTRRAAAILCDILAFIVPLNFKDKLTILASPSLSERIALTTDSLQLFLDELKASGQFNNNDNDTNNDPLGNKLKEIRQDLDNKFANSPNSKSNAYGPNKPGFGGGPKSGKSSKKPELSDEEEEYEELKQRLLKLKLPKEGQKIVDRELKKLKRMHPAQAEYQVCRTYLETIADVPWSLATMDNLHENPVAKARKILDDDHYGLEKVKKRLLEYLAVLHLKHQQQEQKKSLGGDTEGSSTTSVNNTNPENKENNSKQASQSTALVPYQKPDGSSPKVFTVTSAENILTLDKSPILLLVGPPGVGKTSLAKSIAHALGRKFHRISLGGVRDEAEIRGHRRTYVGAMPGILVQSLRKVGVINPVILLDEIDKVSKSNYHGDPSAALLEVLDPEQNHTFTDHYINFPVDLSKTMFIATANSLDDIPGPLLDRMETINLEGYTYMDKQRIANHYLIPKQIKNNGLELDQVKIDEDAVLKIATHYTREAGVRNLERDIGTVCRGKAVEFSKCVEEHKESEYVSRVESGDLKKYLGVEIYEDDMVEDEVDIYVDKDSGKRKHRHTFGVVNGLAYMGSGNGGLLMFEATTMPGNGSLKTTGQLGSVIAESTEIALSWVRANAYKLGLTKSPQDDVVAGIDIHLHAPAGAVPKDGPSAGAAMTLTLVSLLAKRPVPRDLALTGEMTLRGKILAVGGIREKLLGAHIAGIKTVLLPYHTRKVVEEECTFVKETDLEVKYVKYIWDVFGLVWPEEQFAGIVDSHL